MIWLTSRYQKSFGTNTSGFDVVIISDIRLDSLYGLLMIDDVTIWVSYIISTFRIIVITNAYNLIDGMAGSIELVMSFFGYLFFSEGNRLSLYNFSPSLRINPFSKFSWALSEIFMVDTRALL